MLTMKLIPKNEFKKKKKKIIRKKGVLIINGKDKRKVKRR